MCDQRLVLRRYRSLSDREWQWAIEQYELGLLNGSQLAAHFGMSKQGISAGLIKRDAVRGCRASETIKELNLQISRNQLDRELARDVLWRRVEAREAVMVDSIEKMWAAAGFDPAELSAFVGITI